MSEKKIKPPTVLEALLNRNQIKQEGVGRVREACINCKKHHSRCSGEEQCSNCKKKNILCKYNSSILSNENRNTHISQTTKASNEKELLEGNFINNSFCVWILTSGASNDLSYLSQPNGIDINQKNWILSECSENFLECIEYPDDTSRWIGALNLKSLFINQDHWNYFFQNVTELLKEDSRVCDKDIEDSYQTEILDKEKSIEMKRNPGTTESMSPTHSQEQKEWCLWKTFSSKIKKVNYRAYFIEKKSSTVHTSSKDSTDNPRIKSDKIRVDIFYISDIILSNFPKRAPQPSTSLPNNSTKRRRGRLPLRVEDQLVSNGNNND